MEKQISEPDSLNMSYQNLNNKLTILSMSVILRCPLSNWCPEASNELIIQINLTSNKATQK